MQKKWLPVYETYLFQHDLVPLMIERFGMSSHSAGQKLIRERALLCRTFGPEDFEKLKKFSGLISEFLVEASCKNADLAEEYLRKFEILDSKFAES